MEQETLLRKLQLIEKDILDVFVSICEKENLKYYLYGGTVLGAVRHKGFIPWDDDIDVCMPRKDYDIFISIADKYFKDNYELYHYTTKKDYPDYAAKIISKKLILKVKRKNNIVEHNIWIDLFPLDGAPNNKLLRFLHYRKLNIYRWLLMLCYVERFDVHKRRSFIKNFVIVVAKIIPIGKLFNSVKLCKKIDKQLKKQDYDNSIMLGSFLANLREKEMVPRWCYEEGCEVYFENSKYIAPKEAKEYLRLTYGDYMKFPPQENRKPEHHDIISIETI